VSGLRSAPVQANEGLVLFYAIPDRLRGQPQLLCASWVSRSVQAKLKLIPAEKSGLGARLGHPEDFLVALFALSPTLWLLVFLACYLSVECR
jgi:hypothetical protein